MVVLLVCCWGDFISIVTDYAYYRCASISVGPGKPGMPPAALPGAARRVASAGGCSRPAAYIPRQSRERGALRFSVKAKPLRGRCASLDPAPTLNTPSNAPKRAVVAFSHSTPTHPLPMPTKRRYGPFSAV